MNKPKRASSGVCAVSVSVTGTATVAVVRQGVAVQGISS